MGTNEKSRDEHDLALERAREGHEQWLRGKGHGTEFHLERPDLHDRGESSATTSPRTADERISLIERVGAYMMIFGVDSAIAGLLSFIFWIAVAFASIYAATLLGKVIRAMLIG